MGTNSLNKWSWSEIKGRFGKDDQLLPEVNPLEETNDILADAPVRASNLVNGEEFTVTSSLPQASLHARGEGRAAVKGQVQHGTDGVAWFTMQMRVNKEDLEAADNPVTFLSNEEKKYLEAMWQSLAEMSFYGSTGANPKEFNGLDVRLDAIATDSVIDGGGSEASKLTDIWFIQWDLQDCCMIFPKGERGGIYRTPHPDTCLATQQDADNAVADSDKKVAWYTMVDFDWKGGLALADPRRVKRYANIHQTVGHANAFDIRFWNACEEAFTTPGQIYAYMNKRVRLQIRDAADNKFNVSYPANQPFARQQAYIGEIPLRRCDRILLAGSQIT